MQQARDDVFELNKRTMFVVRSRGMRTGEMASGFQEILVTAKLQWIKVE